MKILIIIGCFFPGEKGGGPPVSVDNFCSLMSSEHDIYIVTVNHDLFDTTPYVDISKGWNERENSRVLYLSDAEYNRVSFEKVMNEIEPDILYLQGIFQSCIVPCLQIAKKKGIHVLLAPRGELCSGAFRMKKYKKIPYIFAIRMMRLVKNIHYQSTSDEETEAIRYLLHPDNNHIHLLDNVPSIPKKNYQRAKKNVGEGRFVYISRIHPKKNLISAIKYFNRIKGKVYFDIYGPIEDKEYWNVCLSEIAKLPRNVEVSYKGHVSHEKVHEVFSQYDAFLFPTFSENYGHVIAESLMVGTPVIISDQTPWNDVYENQAGWAIQLNDEDSFVKAIQQIVDSGDNNYLEIIRFARSRIKIENLRIAYNDAIKKIGESV